jgi:hypothetical protein
MNTLQFFVRFGTALAGMLEIFIALLLVVHPMYSQSVESEWTSGNRIMIHGGIALPTGVFGQPIRNPNTNLGAGTPSTNTEFVGNAQLGFAVGAATMYKFTPNISVIGSLDLSYNPFNVSEANRILSESIQGSLGPLAIVGATANASVNSGAYWNAALLVGGRYDLSLMKGLGVYATAQAGLMYSMFPRQEATIGIGIMQPLLGLNVRVDGKATSEAASAFPFAYAIGAGVLIADRVNLGARWLGASPTFNISSSSSFTVTGLPPGTIPSVPSSVSAQNLPMGIVQITVGFIL